MGDGDKEAKVTAPMQPFTSGKRIFKQAPVHVRIKTVKIHLFLICHKHIVLLFSFLIDVKSVDIIPIKCKREG